MARHDHHRPVAAPLRAAAWGVVALITACTGSPAGDSNAGDAAPPTTDAAAELSIDLRPGRGIGPIELGAAYRDVVQAHGPLAQVAPFNRLVVGRLPTLGIEVVLASADASAPSDDAIVIGVGARTTDGVSMTGPARPGMTRAEVEAALGVAPETVDAFAFYPAGVSVEYGSDNVAKRVGVYAAYVLAPLPPPMQPAPE